MKKLSVVSILIWGLLQSIIGAAGTPSEVVRRFCDLDYAGARTQAGRYAPILPLVAYPDEPGWDIAIGIRGYNIKEERISGNLAEVVVEYDIDRSWPSPVEIGRTETFKLILEDGTWRIREYIEYPRVSAEYLCKEFNYCNK